MNVGIYILNKKYNNHLIDNTILTFVIHVVEV